MIPLGALHIYCSLWWVVVNMTRIQKVRGRGGDTKVDIIESHSHPSVYYPPWAPP